MQVRAIIDANQPRLVSAATNAGILIRYSFYLIAALVLGLIGVGTMTVWNSRVTRLDETPRFRLAAPQLARLPMTHQVVTGGRFGRVEIRSYGQLTDRDTDLTIAMMMPPRSVQITSDGMPQFPNIRPLRGAQTVSGSTFYDMETRFGPMRGTEMRAYTDGRWKLCLSFMSRFPTEAVYLNGWYCDASGARPSANQVACMVDQLVLDGQLASSEADSYMRSRLSRPAQCSATPVSQTVDTRTRTQPAPPARWSTPTAWHRW